MAARPTTAGLGKEEKMGAVEQQSFVEANDLPIDFLTHLRAICHDFNNNLGVIGGNMEMALEDLEIDPQSSRYSIEQAMEAVYRLRKMVSHLVIMAETRDFHSAGVSLKKRGGRDQRS